MTDREHMEILKNVLKYKSAAADSSVKFYEGEDGECKPGYEAEYYAALSVLSSILTFEQMVNDPKYAQRVLDIWEERQ